MSFAVFKVMTYEEAEDWICRARLEGVRVIDILNYLNNVKAKKRNGAQTIWYPTHLHRIFKLYGLRKKCGFSGQVQRASGKTFGSWRHWTKCNA